MSIDKISIAVLEDFIKKTRTAIKSNQKEIKISATDAENIVYNLNLILLRLIDKEQDKTPTDNTITIMMDGGSLEEKR